MTRLSRDQIIYTMSPDNTPALRVPAGSTLEVETCDCFTDQIRTPADKLETLDWSRINPATGPIFVEGAEPGDILKVTILAIEMGEQAVVAVSPGAGALPQRITESAVKLLPVHGGFVHFDGMKIPARPMIGVIGTAPAGDPVPTGTPGPHGGNMDCQEIGVGASLFLPVNVPGGLLALGDLHAVMGDGEVCVSGAEIPAVVTLHVEVLKGWDLPLPFLAFSGTGAAIFSADRLDEAVQGATERMADFLARRSGRSFAEMLMLLSLTGNARICQVVDPLKTARMEVPLAIMAKLGIRF